MLARRPAPPFAALPSPRPTPPRPRRPRGNGFAPGSEHTPLPPGRTHRRGAEGGEGGDTPRRSSLPRRGLSESRRRWRPLTPPLRTNGRTVCPCALQASPTSPAPRPALRTRRDAHPLPVVGGGGGEAPARARPASRGFCACSDPSQPRKERFWPKTGRFVCSSSEAAIKSCLRALHKRSRFRGVKGCKSREKLAISSFFFPYSAAQLPVWCKQLPKGSL